MTELQDHVVIVTGAAGNLGQVVSRAFQAAGARLVLVDRREDRLARLFPKLVDDPRALLATSVNLTDPEAVEAMVARAMAHFGRIDCLVNTAGGYRAGDPVDETPLETWDFLMDLNAKTTFLVSRAVIPHMRRQQRGRIINTAAYAALSGKANMGVYIASKSAVIRLTESMAEELRPANINVNCVLPNVIDTPANRKAMPKADYSRWVKPEAIAEVVLFLASDAARSIYGAAIPVRGPC